MEEDFSFDAIDVRQKISFFTKIGRDDLIQSTLEELVAAGQGKEESTSWIQNALGLTYHRQSKFVEAARCFNLAYEAGDDEAALNLMVTLCDLGLYDVAQTVDANLSKVNKTSLSLYRQEKMVSCLFEAAQLYIQTKDFDAAFELLDAALKIAPEKISLKITYANIALSSGRPERVLSCLLPVLESASVTTEVYNILGLAFYRTGQVEKAQQYWTYAQRVKSNDPVSRAFLSTIIKNDNNKN
jgi:tetratricopeptide (TPR) repeat protein